MTKVNYFISSSVARRSRYGRIRSFCVTRIRIRMRFLNPQKKAPVIRFFSLYNIFNTVLSKQFVIFNFNFLSVIRCLHLVRKCHTKFIFLLNIKKHILVRIRKKLDRICHTKFSRLQLHVRFFLLLF